MADHEHRIAVAAMRAARRAGKLRNQSARAKTPTERDGLRQQAEAIEGQIVAAANLLIEGSERRKSNA